jgi:hypothetical protein
MIRPAYVSLIKKATVDLISFLQIGKSLCGIEIGQRRQEVIARFGEQLDQYGEKDYGYLELPKGIRFNYFKDEIDGLAVLNKREDAVFVLHDKDTVLTAALLDRHTHKAYL